MISEFPLFVFTTLGGLSAGLCMVAALFPPRDEGKRVWLVPLVCLVLLGAGLLGVLFHLGRPERFIFGLRNPQAGIAQEGYAAIVLGVLYLAWLYLAWRGKRVPRALVIVAGAVALVLTIIMGLAYANITATLAWSTWRTIPLFVVGDFAMGLALWGALNRVAYEGAAFTATNAVTQVAFAAFAVIIALHFASVGQNATLFYVAAVSSVVAALAAIAQSRRPGIVLASVVGVVAIVAVVIARVAFYSI